MASGAMMYIPSFVKTGLGIQKLLGEDTVTQTARWSHKPNFFFQLREVG
jgi:hypothetical protein